MKDDGTILGPRREDAARPGRLPDARNADAAVRVDRAHDDRERLPDQPHALVARGLRHATRPPTARTAARGRPRRWRGRSSSTGSRTSWSSIRSTSAAGTCSTLEEQPSKMMTGPTIEGCRGARHARARRRAGRLRRASARSSVAPARRAGSSASASRPTSSRRPGRRTSSRRSGSRSAASAPSLGSSRTAI